MASRCYRASGCREIGSRGRRVIINKMLGLKGKDLDQALFHGSSIGGARPKALIEEDDIKYIAKFSASTDIYSVVKAEFIAMRLAALVGLNVAPVTPPFGMASN